MKTITAVIALMLCGYIGFSKGYAITLREKAMSAFAVDVRRLIGELQIRPRDMADITRLLYDGRLGQFWRDFTNGLSGSGGAEEAWQKAVAEYKGFCVLCAEEKSIIDSFGYGLGQSGMDTQTDAFGRVERAALERAETLKREACTRGGLYTKLGVLFGLGMALMII